MIDVSEGEEFEGIVRWIVISGVLFVIFVFCLWIVCVGSVFLNILIFVL